MIARRAAHARWLAIGCALAWLAPVRDALALQRCPVLPTPARAEAWPAPLDRLVSIDARDIKLRAALDRLSATAATPFAYAPDLLSLDGRVCVVAEGQPLGRVLQMLLGGSGVRPSVVAGRVVLTPGDREARTASPARPDRVDVLDRVVVTGSAVASARRALTVGTDVIEGDEIRRRGTGALSEILDAAAPGAWLWASPSTLTANYAGVRGSSSFGASAPKIYLDGIEVANPLLVTQLDPDAIDHIEIIRGPQGSALYGSDAISGVINVLTRHDGPSSTGSRVFLSSAAGASSSAFGTSFVPTHEQRLAVRLGDDVRSAGVAAQVEQTGAIFPSAETRMTSLVADARAVGGRTIWTGDARLFDRRVGGGANPLVTSALLADSAATSATISTPATSTAQSAREYTLGASMTHATSGPWTNSFVAGIDGYHVNQPNAGAGLFPSGVDSSALAALGSGLRTTLRASSVGRFGGERDDPAMTLTFGVEQSVLRLDVPAATITAPFSLERIPLAGDSLTPRWNHNLGAYVQAAESIDDEYYLTAGLRVEQNDAFTGANRRALLPMLGVATVRELGPATLKLRAAYGRGIRPPSISTRAAYAMPGNATALAPALDPESQAGTELGAELYFGRALSFQVTRFDQVASGLIQNVMVGIDTVLRAGRLQHHMLYQLQNVGEIGNHGWELRGAVSHDAFSLTSALTFVDSRVESVARGYGGDLRVGDRMLGVPASTASLTAAWTARDWSGAITASRAANWINYDQVALARAWAAAADADDVAGERLRPYWMRYAGDTHLRATGSHALRGGIEAVVTGDNLLGGQLGEPDNVTIRPGRTITVGLRAAF